MARQASRHHGFRRWRPAQPGYAPPVRLRLTKLCLPVLVILVMSWGTCPCFYVEILSGGLLSFGPDGCTCAATDHCTQVELTIWSLGSSGTDDCPCPLIESGGVMHELPQPAGEPQCTPVELWAVSDVFVLQPPLPPRYGRRLPSSSDPGPEHQSVVLLV